MAAAYIELSGRQLAGDGVLPASTAALLPNA
jgi:hypothetical protein